jgi:hypothetical protein
VKLWALEILAGLLVVAALVALALLPGVRR